MKVFNLFLSATLSLFLLSQSARAEGRGACYIRVQFVANTHDTDAIEDAMKTLCYENLNMAECQTKAKKLKETHYLVTYVNVLAVGLNQSCQEGAFE